jgi:hypothetical protein
MTYYRQLGLFLYLMTFPIVQMYWKQRDTVNVSLLIFRMIQQYKDNCILMYSARSLFIHLAVCLTTGPKPLPKRALHIVRSRAFSFK